MKSYQHKLTSAFEFYWINSIHSVIKCLMFSPILAYSLFANAQLDSCGNDFRPMNTLNKYEVGFLNEFIAVKPLVLNDSIKIAFVNGLLGRPLIVTKREFFKDVKHWSKSSLNPELIVLSEQEKLNSQGYDALLIYDFNDFDSQDKSKTLEYLKRGEIHLEPSRTTPFQNSYVGTLGFINDHYDTSKILVQQGRDQIVISPKNDSCFTIVYDIMESADDEEDICYKVTYKTTCNNCNKTLLNSAFDLMSWIPVDSTTYVSSYGIVTYKPPSEKKIKKALIYKMIILEDEKNGTITINLTMDEMDFKEFRACKKQRKNHANSKEKS